MLDVESVLAYESRLQPGISVGRAMDLVYPLLKQCGFEVLAYDYSPVPLTREGDLITPSVLNLYRAPEEMESLWSREGYYQIDPVMDASLRTTRPFTWAHGGRHSRVMRDTLAERHGPVVRYLQDVHMTSGITVPIRAEGGALATFTAMRREPAARDEAVLELAQVAMGQLGHMFHDAVYPGFDASERRCRHIRLTPRERQCLRMCANGLTTKQIAHELCRSVPTVTLHLNSAIRRLGARNRFQAVAIAAYYRLLEPDV